jgi:hypothetical protein
VSQNVFFLLLEINFFVFLRELFPRFRKNTYNFRTVQFRRLFFDLRKLIFQIKNISSIALFWLNYSSQKFWIWEHKVWAFDSTLVNEESFFFKFLAFFLISNLVFFIKKNKLLFFSFWKRFPLCCKQFCNFNQFNICIFFH